jgi:hypothetical protein
MKENAIERMNVQKPKKKKMKAMRKISLRQPYLPTIVISATPMTPIDPKPKSTANKAVTTKVTIFMYGEMRVLMSPMLLSTEFAVLKTVPLI